MASFENNMLRNAGQFGQVFKDARPTIERMSGL